MNEITIRKVKIIITFKIHLVSSYENGSKKSLIKGCEIQFQYVKIVKIIV